MSSNLEIARRYLDALASGVTGADLARFFAPDVIQEEYPNRLNPHGGRSDLAAILERSERGRHVLSSQSFDIQQAFASGEQVAVEAIWTGTLAIPVGALPAGGVMRAHFAIFLEFRDGKIVAQRNYDCFDPF